MSKLKAMYPAKGRDNYIKPLYDEAKSRELYHFDHDAVDDDDLILKKKFNGTFEDEISKFESDYILNWDLKNEYLGMQLAEWLSLGYDIRKQNHKMQPNDDTPKVKKMIESVPLEDEGRTGLITWQPPFYHIPYHLDVLASTGLDPEVTIKDGYRVLIFLTDWWPGEYLIWGNTTIDHWKAGDVLAWPAFKYPHGTCNISHHTGYRVRLSGIGGDQFKEWIASDDIIEV
tara:strand:+ start:1825 stop:2511 length:687 start_codon:yes stop_codon:yes gene_type:complete